LRATLHGSVDRCQPIGGEAFSADASLIKADVDKKKRAPGEQPIAWPKAEEASHSVREYLAALDAARSDEGSGGGSSGGSNRRKPPKEVSLTDPQATWVARPGVDPFFAYDANYPIDNKNIPAFWVPVTPLYALSALAALGLAFRAGSQG
jgi:hypothetical protein